MAFGIVQHLRSSRSGARPGDGTVRSLLDGEFFINEADAVLCYLAASGALQVGYFLTATGFASFVASLPTVEPSTPGLPWNNSGTPQISQAGS